MQLIGFRTISSEVAHELNQYLQARARARRIRDRSERREGLRELREGGHRDLWIGILVALCSLGLAGWTWNGGIEAWIGLPLSLLGLLLAIRQVFKDRRERRVLRERTRDRLNLLKIVDFATYSLVDFSKSFVLPENYVNSGYRIDYLHHGFGAWSPQVTDWLLSEEASAAQYSHQESEFQPSQVIQITISPFVELQRTVASATFRNDPKIRLRTDLVRNSSGAFPQSIQLQRTHYLMTACTNDLSFKEVIDREDRSVLYNGMDAFLRRQDDKLMIRPLSNSGCANQLGVSTIAFTQDGYMILVDQTRNNLQSAGLLAPSGSGSLDEYDLPNPGGRGDFLRWLLMACRRELCEELGIARSEEFGPETNALLEEVQIGTLPIGFCTYLHRGSKPEFFFLARLSCTASRLRSLGIYSSEERRLSRRFAEEDHYRLENDGDTANQLMRICTELREREGYRLSFPLEMQMLLLGYVCNSHPDRLRSFFMDPADSPQIRPASGLEGSA